MAAMVAQPSPSSAMTDKCFKCNHAFSLFTRKHHCHHCQRVVCASCSPSTRVLPGSTEPQRVCVDCEILLRSGDSRAAAAVLSPAMSTTPRSNASTPRRGSEPTPVTVEKPTAASLLAPAGGAASASTNSSNSNSSSPPNLTLTLSPSPFPSTSLTPMAARSSTSAIAAPQHRVMTPQPRRRRIAGSAAAGRNLGMPLNDDSAIDHDLMPNFVFLKNGKPMTAAVLPPPTPPPRRNSSSSHLAASATAALTTHSSGSRSGANSPTSQSRSSRSRSTGDPFASSAPAPVQRVTPRNMQLASEHLYAEQTELATTPRHWTFTSPAGMETSSSGSEKSEKSVSSRPPPLKTMYTQRSLTEKERIAAQTAAEEAFTQGGLLSPTKLYAPVVLGSGVLNDVKSTNERVMQCMRKGGCCVFVDETRLVEDVTEFRAIFARASEHRPEEAQFATHLMVKKYNTDARGLELDHIPHSPDVEVVQKLLHANGSSERPPAVPFAPHQWYFNPANVPLVVAYHLVLQTIDFGLREYAEGVHEPHLEGVNPATGEPIVRYTHRPYTSLDLAQALADVAKATPHAFEPESLTRMSEMRLGSWLQPELFRAMLDEHPELLQNEHAGSSEGPVLINDDGKPGLTRRESASELPTIKWTFPGLAERARLLRELGFVLLRFFNGSPVKLVEACDHSASRLVELLTQHLPGMRDAAIYRGQFVFFYTRAQGFVRNLWIAFHGTHIGAFADLEQVCGQADGVLQVIFHQYGWIKYSNELTRWVRSGMDVVLLATDVEVEIRAATGYVLRRICELLGNLDTKTLQLQLDAFLRSHYRAATHDLESFLPNEQGEVRQILPLMPIHRSTGVWY